MTPATFDPGRPETWPLIVTYAEVCSILRISRRTGDRLRSRHNFPIPELAPPISEGPRFHRDDVLQALKSRSGQASALERRKALHGVR